MPAGAGHSQANASCALHVCGSCRCNRLLPYGVFFRVATVPLHPPPLIQLTEPSCSTKGVHPGVLHAMHCAPCLKAPRWNGKTHSWACFQGSRLYRYFAPMCTQQRSTPPPSMHRPHQEISRPKRQFQKAEHMPLCKVLRSRALPCVGQTHITLRLSAPCAQLVPNVTESRAMRAPVLLTIRFCSLAPSCCNFSQLLAVLFDEVLQHVGPRATEALHASPALVVYERGLRGEGGRVPRRNGSAFRTSPSPKPIRC